MKETFKNLVKALICIVLILAAIRFCDVNSFDEDHQVAMIIATQVLESCKTSKICPDNLEFIKLETQASTQGAGDLPMKFEYRLATDKKRFVINYKGTFDPDCGFALYGGVTVEVRKQMLCEDQLWAELRQLYSTVVEMK